MARMHSRKKGKSGRKRPKSKKPPEWLDVEKAEVEELILKMAREGVSPSKIGLVLRDRHGIPAVRTIIGMPIAKFLKKNKVGSEYPEDFTELLRRAVRMNKHLKKSKKDVHNKTKYQHVVSKVLRLAKYYEKKGRIPKGWKYDPDQAELLVK
jgi:small subunit ribosomal protein S15